MATETMDETDTSNDNAATRKKLIRDATSIETATINWMAEATALYGAVLPADQSVVLALRADLVARLNAATAI